MERTRVILPGSSLSAIHGPKYYDITDLYVGASLEVLCHQFVLIDADEFAFNFLESEPKRFPHSNRELVKEKFSVMFSSLKPEQKEHFREILQKADPKGTNIVEREVVVAAAKSFFPTVSEQEVITFARLFEFSPKSVQYNMIFA